MKNFLIAYKAKELKDNLARLLVEIKKEPCAKVQL